ncbi:hypothetical protein M885DRAFT_323000 [Pelagophyceae sp. CCMP2097]|nr:hypothetical protein M885DRAFT_323000 [Pelagophyceae sp. CCMP2097]
MESTARKSRIRAHVPIDRAANGSARFDCWHLGSGVTSHGIIRITRQPSDTSTVEICRLEKTARRRSAQLPGVDALLDVVVDESEERGEWERGRKASGWLSLSGAQGPPRKTRSFPRWKTFSRPVCARKARPGVLPRRSHFEKPLLKKPLLKKPLLKKPLLKKGPFEGPSRRARREGPVHNSHGGAKTCEGPLTRPPPRI